MKKPCNETCPKCGSDKAGRAWKQVGDIDTNINDYQEEFEDEYMYVYGYEIKYLKECIKITCHCCGYDWITDVLSEETE